MSFTPQFDGYTPGDLFYGLAKTRDALMVQLKVPTDHAAGARINYFDIGDIKVPTQPRPLDNEAFRQWLGVHKKYSKVVNMQNVNYEWRHWRQKSKGGIEWATKYANPRKHVHFCLDKMTDPLTQMAIVTKTYGDDSPKGTPWDQKIRSITNAELRWIYRHRNEGGVKKYVQFWENGKQCGPPWERPELQDVWKAYTPAYA